MKSLLRNFAVVAIVTGNAVLALGLMLAFALPASAQTTNYWDGPSGSWGTVANWSTDPNNSTPNPVAVPGNTVDVVFNISSASQNTNVTLDATRSALSLTFNNTGTTLLRGNSAVTTARILTLGSGGITLNSGAGAVTIGDTPATYGAVNMTLSGTQTWKNDSSNLLTLSGTTSLGANKLTLAGSGAGGITLSGIISSTTAGNGVEVDMSGGGIGTLSAANTFNGGLTIKSGTVSLGNATAAGAGAVTLGGVGTSATLDLNGASRTIAGVLGTAGLAANQTITNTALSTGTLTLTGAVTSTFGGLIKDGASAATAVTLNNAAASFTLPANNTYSGTTTLTAGTLVAGHTNAFGNSALALDGGTLDLATDTSISAYNVLVGFNKNATIASNKATPSSAGITHTLGTLSFGTGTTNRNCTLTVTKGANVSGGSAGVTFGAVALAGGNSAVTFDVASDVNLTVGALNEGPTTSVSKNGGGTLTLTSAATRNANNFTTLNAGTLRVENLTAINVGNGIDLNFSGGTLVVSVDQGGAVTGSRMVMNAGTAATMVIDRQTPGAGVTNTFASIKSLQTAQFNVLGGDNVTSGTAGATITAISAAAGSPTFNIVNPVAANTRTLLTLPTAALGANSLTVKGSGNLAQTGVWSSTGGQVMFASDFSGLAALNQANTFTGGTVIDGGTVQIGVASVGTVASPTSSAVGRGGLTLGGGGLSSNNTTARTILNAVTFTGNATLGDAVNTGTLTFSNTWALGAADRTVTVNSVVTSTNVISSAGAGLIKAGGSTLELLGVNTYTGNTTINNGTLKLAGTGAIDASPQITVGSGAFFDVAGVTGGYQVKNGQTLKGVGTLVGALSLNSGALLAPGDGLGTGSFTINGNLALAAGAFLAFEPGKTISADLTGGATLTLADSFGVDDLRSWSGGAIDWITVATGTYTLFEGVGLPGNIQNIGFANRATGLGGGKEAYFQAGSMQLVVVPEPSTLALAGLGIGLAGILACRRSRRG